ncbi:protein slx4 [Aspergillus melleus]|uniref:protein slx4 n=1 Tax=Aspergillus melleus TaxID=138277 RepID=UPI001E8E5226|nr:5'-flap endonuclease [Aspergillus melleus]KAH8423216.1 5'-flap endonuclease [Aspergillus melleus]
MSAAADVILLDSSPEQPSSHTPAHATSGPEYPLDELSPILSPSELFRPPSQSRFFTTDNPGAKRSNVKGIKALNGRDANSGNIDVEGEETISRNKPTRGRKKATNKGQEGLETATSDHNQKETVPKKPRATKAKSAEGPKKRGRPSTKTATNNKTLSGRVAKAGNVQPKESDEKTKRPSTPKSSSGGTSVKDPVDWEKEGLQLEAATKRRLDWTPTKDTMEQAVETGRAEGVSDNTSNGFGSLLADYNFSGGSSLTQTSSGIPEDGFITKRRRIELVDSRLNPESRQRSSEEDKPSTEEEQSSNAPGPKKRRQKQPKKLTTLTARVTAQYNDNLTESSGLLATTKDSTPVQTKTTKSKGKGKSKPQEPEFIVLSPEAAAKCLDDQDLVFGTCSQLQREDSPTLLKEMQAAMLESEKSITSASTPRGPWFKPSSTTTVSRFTTPRNLWSVAARDSEGSLAQVEVVDLSESPDLPKLSSINTNKFWADSKQKQSKEPDVTPDVTPDVSSYNEVPEPQKTSLSDKELFQIARQNTNPVEGPKEKTQPTESLPQMPRYAGFTDAELSRQVADYGFKAIKSRKKMIELLQKCWESKHATSVSVDRDHKQDNAPSKPTTDPPTQSQTTGKRTRKVASASQTITTKATKSQPSKSSKPTTKSKTKPSTSPFKASTKQTASQLESSQAPSIRSFAEIEEIQDSEDELTPSPSRLLSRYTFPTTERLSLPMSPIPSTPTRSTTRSHLQQSAAPQPTKPSAPPDLANQITKAVRTQAQHRASNAPHKHLTWHEKMLMYDPIILEDFTGWLNTEGLALVAEDREVGAGFVRQWCENHSICCCYR